MAEFPWQISKEDVQSALFPDESAVDKRMGVGEFAGLEFIHVNAKKVINEVPGTNLPFRFTVNAYRGCSHACTYCFARPTHKFLEMNIGEDFERRIVVKVNAVERLAAELASPKWGGDGIAMGSNTDPYQRAEGKYQITRGLIQVLGAHSNPFSILTKGTLIGRDMDVLTDAARNTAVQCNFSIPTLDVSVWKATEPGTPHPRQRLKVLKQLSEAGINCGALIAPIIPGLSDSTAQIKEVVDASVDAGATWVAASGLHLKPGLKDYWMKWLQDAYPDLVPLHNDLYSGRSFLEAETRQSISGTAKQHLAAARRRTGTPVTDRQTLIPADTRVKAATTTPPKYQDAMF